MELGAWRLEERRLIHFIVRRFAVDGGDYVAGFDAGLRAGAVGQDSHRLQPMTEGIEYEPGAIEDFGLSRALCCFKIDLDSHAIEDLSEIAENVLPDVAGEISCVRRVRAEAPDDAWDSNYARLVR
jgi:hypothetical protein